jgi:transcriptional regulator with XRE-family HTH domain
MWDISPMSKVPAADASLVVKGIYARMVAAGMTQKSLAIAAGLKDGYVRDLFRGKSSTQALENMFRIADALNCSVQELSSAPSSEAGPKFQFERQCNPDEAALLKSFRLAPIEKQKEILASVQATITCVGSEPEPEFCPTSPRQPDHDLKKSRAHISDQLEPQPKVSVEHIRQTESQYLASKQFADKTYGAYSYFVIYGLAPSADGKDRNVASEDHLGSVVHNTVVRLRDKLMSEDLARHLVESVLWFAVNAAHCATPTTRRGRKGQSSSSKLSVVKTRA